MLKLALISSSYIFTSFSFCYGESSFYKFVIRTLNSLIQESNLEFALITSF